VREIAPGLYHWTAPHPAHRPDAEPGSAADWPADVGSVLYDAPGGVVLIDPMVSDDAWPALDEIVAGRPVTVLTTIRFHTRSRAVVLERYGGANVRFDEPMPDGVEAFPFPRFDETIYWLPEPRALVAGDRLVGDGAGGLRLCPASWLDYIPMCGTLEDLRVSLGVLLELPVEHVLVSHWAPVVGGGGRALAAALGGR
jgi:hypothetical protein